jgi:hypothetical protein
LAAEEGVVAEVTKGEFVLSLLVESADVVDIQLEIPRRW